MASKKATILAKPRRKVLAGGRFNILHPGHIFFLEQARALGDALVVVVASDRTVRAQKKRLVFPQEERRNMVAALACVDEAIIGYDIRGMAGYARIIRKVRPAVIALGYDQGNPDAIRKLARRAGVECEVIRVCNYKGYQSKKIIKRK